MYNILVKYIVRIKNVCSLFVNILGYTKLYDLEYDSITLWFKTENRPERSQSQFR